MGDRGNIKITDGESTVFLYTHWCGSDLPEIVKAGLRLPEARARWNDGYYLARILFENLIAHGSSKETGFGISSKVGDGEDQILAIDINAQTVRWREGKRVSFEAFTK